MKITALAPWFGAKRTLAPRIVEALGPHRCYWEPFCGSMAVLLAKPPCSTETVNDLHGDLVNLSRVILRELARRTGLSPTYLCRVLYGDVRISASAYLTVEAIARGK